MIIAVVLATASWFASNHYLPWSSFEGQLAAAFAAAILAGVTLTQPAPEKHEWPWLACFTLAVCVIPWVQYALGQLAFSGDAWLVSGYLGAFGLAQFTGRRIARSVGLESLLERSSWLVLAASLLCMWLALYQWFNLTYLSPFAMELPLPQTRPIANFGQPNHLALALTLGAIAGASLYERNRISGAITLLLTSFFALGAVMTQSRAAVLIWIALASWLALSSWRGALQRLTPPRIALGLVCASMAYVVWPSLLDLRVGVAGLSDARALEGMVSPGLRPLHWASMVDAIGRSPWFGYGWNQVVAAQYLVAPDHPATTEMLGDSHNLILDLMVHNGLIVGGTIAAALAYWLVRHLLSARDPARVLALGAVLIFALASMVEFPLNYTYFLLPVGMIMGALSCGTPWDRTLAIPRWFAPTLLASLTALCAVIANEYFAAEEDLRALRFEQQRVGRPVARTFASEARVLTQLAGFFKFADSRQGRDDLTSEELALRHSVAMRYPNWSLLSLFASDLARNGHPDEAAEVLKRICRTQKPDECRLAQVRWEIWSKEDTRIARIPFPPIPPRP